jgi:hypothetical protein
VIDEQSMLEKARTQVIDAVAASLVAMAKE